MARSHNFLYEDLKKRVDKKLLNKVSIFTDIDKADFSKKSVYWACNSPSNTSLNFLSDLDYFKKIDYFVFPTYWLADFYRKSFDIPDEKVNVIKYANSGISTLKSKNKNKVKICYTSSPWRGLNILLDAWEKINCTDVELDIYSGISLYGKEFYTGQDTFNNFLYNKCNNLKNVNYLKDFDLTKLKKILPEYHLMAYPCTYSEPTGVEVIDSLCAGTRVVCSSHGCLPEVTEGWAKMYPVIVNTDYHVENFASILESEINAVKDGIYDEQFNLQAEIYSPNWDWEERKYDWEDFLDYIVE